MPNAGVLPYVPSPFEQLTPYINQAVGDVSQGIEKRFANAADDKILAGLGSGSQSPIEIAKSISRLSPERAKNFTSGLEAAQKIQVQKNDSSDLRNSLTKLKELVPFSETTGQRGNISWLGKKKGLSAENIQAREELDTLGFLVADKIYTHFNKGTMSNAKLEQVKKQIAPRSDLSERENIARINALERIMALPPDVSPEKLDAVIDQGSKEVEKNSIKERPSLESFAR